MLRRSFLTLAAGAALWPTLARAQENNGLTPIEPANDLERAFVAAFADPEQRDEFRRLLLESDVALAMQSNLPDASPRLLNLGERGEAGFIFTSSARLSEIMGPAAARAIIPGREALTRLRGKNAVLNWRLAPMLTLEPADVASYIAS